MGVYLAQPVTTKTTHSDSNSEFKYTSCEMQGWRKFMEDAKITELAVKGNLKSYSVFGVFDGHGGSYLQLYRCRSLSIRRKIFHRRAHQKLRF